MYCAVIGDIVKSKLISSAERDAVQRRLDSLLNDINNQYSAHISANFTLTLGDEFQGLLNESAFVLEIIGALIKNMHPQKIRFGIGIGDINTAIDPEKALRADGSAYHFARKALITLKENEMPAKSSASGISPMFLVRFETGAADSSLLNLNCGFIGGIMSNWSEKQWETVKTVMEKAGSQSKAAADMGLSKSTVTRSLQAARYGECQTAARELSAYLKDTYDTTVTASVRLQQALNLIESAEYLTNTQIDYDLALNKHKEALFIRQSVLPENDGRIAQSLDFVGGVYLKKKTGQSALEYFEKALDIKKEVYGDEETETAKSYLNIGDALLLLAKSEEAYLSYNKAKNILESVVGAENPDTALAYYGMANVYFEKGEYEKALEWHQKAYEIRKKILGENNRYTADSYDRMADVYRIKGKHEKALKLYFESLNIREKVLVPLHPDTMASYYNIAEIYDGQG
ncbi:MAG: SatD family protein, partial [Oscillospiraceae bacterium]|nr:SatD family protein [Oscillospiraceae bacterium]